MSEIDKELSMLKSERAASRIALDGQRDYYAAMMRNGLGNEIDEALKGNLRLKMTTKSKIKDWIRKYFWHDKDGLDSTS